MKTILYNPIFINPQAYYVFPNLNGQLVEQKDATIEPAKYSGIIEVKVIANGDSKLIRYYSNTNKIDLSEFKDSWIRINLYTDLGAVVLGEWKLQISTCIVTYGEETQGILQKVKTNETNISTLKEKVGTLLCEFCETHKIKPVVECGAMSYKYDTDAKKEWISKVNSWIRGGSIRFVDWAGNLTQNDKITADICNSGSIYESLPFNSDGVHPSLAGHQKIFECYQREMAELFNE